MNQTSQQQLRREFDVTPAMAAWVVLTHVFVLATPLVLIWAVVTYGHQMPTPFASPLLVIIAATVYIGSTAFEVAQNSADRWYLTEATRSVADLTFLTFNTLSFWLFIVGFVGLGWIALIALVPTLLFPLAYIANHPSHRPISGIVFFLATFCLFRVTDNPATFLFIVVNGVAIVFIIFLIKRQAQALHGWGALFFGLAFLAWPWAVVGAATDTRMSWLTLAITTIAIAAVMGALVPALNRAQATPRQFA